MLWELIALLVKFVIWLLTRLPLLVGAWLGYFVAWMLVPTKKFNELITDSDLGTWLCNMNLHIWKCYKAEDWIVFYECNRENCKAVKHVSLRGPS